jgi:hypothetical protein
MIKSLKAIVIPLGILLALAFILFLVNQVSGLYLMADRINPLWGQIVLITCSVIIFGLLAYPLVSFMRMPRPLSPPQKDAEVERYQQKLVSRLAGNSILRENNYKLKTTKDLPEAIELLNKEANKTIRETATVIFLTTSVSQNGKLDAFTVLGAQMRMVWRIGKIYYQRPTLREIMRLYTFVGTSSFIASEIEDLDITKQIEPVATALFKNASGRSVPLIGPAATIIMDSLLEGSTNAFLSLRVGILTKKYCSSLEVFDKKKAKKETLKEAAKELRFVSVDASAKVISGLLSATKNAGIDTLRSGWEGVKKTGERVSNTIKAPFTKKKKELPEA